MSVESAIHAFVREHQEVETRFLADIVKIPSDNPPGDCDRSAEAVARLLEGLGFSVERHTVPDALVKANGMISATNLIVRRKFGQGGPTIALKVQELFGLKDHPSLAGGRIPLTLELLSPAHRPIQITRDLPGFWRGSWGAVRSDLRGRYPRHFWPEDPAAAAPTARAKPRGT